MAWASVNPAALALATKATRLASMAAAFSASELDEFGIGVGFIELLL